MVEKREGDELTNDSKKPRLEESAPLKKAVDSINELDVGITQYVNADLAGFQGVIKQRYTDFLVNEIGLDGEVIRFTDDGLGDLKKWRQKNRREAEEKEEPNKQELEKEEPKKLEEEEPKKQEFNVTDEDNTKLLELFSQEDIDQLILVANNQLASYESKTPVTSKEQRTKIHQAIRSCFQSKIESKTTEQNTFKFTMIHQRSRQPSHKNKRPTLEDTRDANGVENYGLGPLKQYLNFNLYKENKDTMECVSKLAQFLKIPFKAVRIAGTKDRRGVTVQRCSVAKIKVERMNTLNGGLRGAKIGGFSYSDEGVRLGALLGNEFVIAIREVQSTATEEELKESFQKLAQNGFINYYGMQRFGTFSVSTHSIGKEILLSNWKAACELILSEQELAIPDSKPGRKIWAETRDAKAAAAQMPHRCIAESTILKSLASSQKDGQEWRDADFFNAIQVIPRNLRIMYGHAYQSYIWNCVASKRMELFGNTVVVGDLVIDEENSSQAITDDDDFAEDIRTDKFVRSKPVTEEDVKSGKYSIFDIVLPSPGFDVQYPTNEQIMDIYKNVMGADGLDPLNMTRKVKDFSFAGSYRKVLSKPKDLVCFTRHYKENNQDLIYTDKTLLEMKRASNEVFSEEDARIIPDEGGDKLAVILRFKLDTSCYATMMLREVMRMDTARHGDLCDVKQ